MNRDGASKWLLLTAGGGIIGGIGLLIFAKYLLTNFAFSISQVHKSHCAHDAGLAVLFIGLIGLIIYVAQSTGRRQR